MRNFWVAIIGVILFAGTSFATAPVVQDIPDIKLLTGSGVVDDFDLSDYVTDYDDDPAGLTYTIESQVGFSVDPASIAGSLVDIAGSSTADEGTVTYRAADAAEYDEGTQVVKYSSMLLVGPSLTEDRNLDPASDVLPRTWVIVADNVLTTTGIKALVSGSTPDEMSVCIADLDGNNLTAAGASAESGDLSAAIDASGVLTLQAPAGSYPITGPNQLSGAYRVGVKAAMSGGDNWDGLELLVSTARLPEGNDGIGPLDTAAYERFCDFEAPAGALPVGQSVMRGLADNVNPNWYQSASGLASIVDTGIPSSTWATSGNALKVTLASGSDSVFIQSEMFTNIAPGETVTFAANVYTDVTTGAFPTVTFFMGSFHSPSNYDGVVLQRGANDNKIDQLPSIDWRTLRASFTADELGASLLGGTFDIYQKGYQAAVAIAAPPASGAYPINVYIDNVRVYRDKTDLDKALAATEIVVAVKEDTPALSTEILDGSFESLTDLADGGWLVGTSDATLDTTGVHNAPSHDGAKALKINSGLCRIEARLDGSNIASGTYPDNRGDGIYGASLWFKTDAADLKNLPGIMFFYGDAVFKNVPFSDTGYAGAPLSGAGWKKVTLSSVRSSAGVVQLAVNVRAGAPPTRAYFPDDLVALGGKSLGGDTAGTGANVIGELSDANVYVDDVQFHMVGDESMYFDRSVFP